MYSAQLTQSGDSRLQNKDGGAGHHPVVVVLGAGAPLLGRQRPAGLRVWVRHTERLHTVVSLTEDDVALEVDGVGVREPEHRVQPGGRHSPVGVKHELGQNISLRTSETREQLVSGRWEIGDNVPFTVEKSDRAVLVTECKAVPNFDAVFVCNRILL